MKREKKIRNRQGVIRLLQMLSYGHPRRFDAPIRSIAILLPERYGDCILLTKLLRELRSSLPEASIHLIAFRKVSEAFFDHDPNVSEVFNVKSGILEWLKFFLTHRFDVLFNPKDSLSVSFIMQSMLLRAKCKIAHQSDFHIGIYDRLIDQDYYNHVTIRNGGLLDVLGLHVSDRASIRPYMPSLPVSESMHSYCRSIESKGYAGLNLSSGSAGKYWPKEKWAELVSRFPDQRFVVFSSSQDMADKLFLEKELTNVVASPATATLGEVEAMLKQLIFLVSPDTSLVHMAACLDTPVVALYRIRRNDWTRFAPLSSNNEIVVSPVDRVEAIDVDAVSIAVTKVRGRC